MELPEISEIIPGTVEFRLKMLEVERKPAECPVRLIFTVPLLISDFRSAVNPTLRTPRFLVASTVTTFVRLVRTN